MIERLAPPGTDKQASNKGTVSVKSGNCKCGASRIDSQLGLEHTPEEYVAKMVEVFREVRRVLRSDGTLWLNLGDSYWSDTLSRKDQVESMWGNRPASDLENGRDAIPQNNRRGGLGKRPEGLKPKDLCGIPWRVAFALQADGWYLRQDIIWSKPNPMPESVRDRCTKSHEYIFLLSKSAKYFYDAEAIREPHKRDFSNEGGGWENGEYKHKENTAWKNDPLCTRGANQKFYFNPNGRNKRSVWTVATAPFPGAHFATFPPKLIEPCILAGCPDKCCPKCGKGWERVVESQRVMRHELPQDNPNYRPGRYTVKSSGKDDYSKGGGQAFKFSNTLGFQPTCNCGLEDTISGTVLDPFGGSGTVGMVAEQNGRNSILIELNPKYVDMAKRRTAQQGLFT